jgi:hypothetical protein
MKKLKILMFGMILNFKFIYNPKKNYNYDSPNNPPNYLSPIISGFHSEFLVEIGGLEWMGVVHGGIIMDTLPQVLHDS